MTATTAERMRAWSGPTILAYGFRPFFFGAAVWAVLSMLLWVPMLSGRVVLPTAFDHVSWHAHEFLFGYLGTVIANGDLAHAILFGTFAGFAALGMWVVDRRRRREMAETWHWGSASMWRFFGCTLGFSG